MLNYTTEQLWKNYDKLPEELKDAIFSEEAGDDIYDACKRSGIEDKAYEVSRLVGYVLFGVLPPEEFSDALQKELNLKKDTAKKVAQDINRFVFYPVKKELASLYKIEEEPLKTKPKKPIIPSEIEASPPPESEPSPPEKPDIYREPIE